MSVLSTFYNNFILQSNAQDLTLRASDVIKYGRSCWTILTDYKSCYVLCRDNLLASTMFIEGNPEAATIKGTILLIQGTFDVQLNDFLPHLSPVERLPLSF